MNALATIKSRFSEALKPFTDQPADILGMIRPANAPGFGDYQANCAMPLGNQLGKPPREIAGEIVARLDLGDVCQGVEIAGPGFINLTLSEAWLQARLRAAMQDPRLAVEETTAARTFVVDFSSPNVAKPMHVGHIRSTVIGDAIARTLRFAGQRVITDNHLGDWGTQFGMIIYGYKHFVDEAAYQQAPVTELGRLYKLVRKLTDYHSAVGGLAEREAEQLTLKAAVEQARQHAPSGDKQADKQARKKLDAAVKRAADCDAAVAQLHATIDDIQADPNLAKLAEQHPDIAAAVLQETAALHAGDATNYRLWEQFLPHCRQDIQRIYARLGVAFDHELGESFYHDQLAAVVDDLEARGFTRESNGATCVFLDNHETPMIVRKRDGAFLYATTDLATIKYRMEHWHADASLYVVDHRQSEHFEKLFDVARLWGYDKAELRHVSFGTVLGKDKKPYKTRSGDTVGLEGLLDQAEARALDIARDVNPDLDAESLQHISRVIGIGGIKYADLAHNRTSDYVFDYDKMLALKGNTSTFVQYGYARVQGIIRRTETDPEVLRNDPVEFELATPIERQLAVKLIQFAETIDDVLVDYKPNLMCAYLFELTQMFHQFFDQCPVKDAESPTLQASRLQICDLTARTIKVGLDLLGIEVLDQM